MLYSVLVLASTLLIQSGDPLADHLTPAGPEDIRECVRLGAEQELLVPPALVLSDEERARIKDLIGRLADLESPDFGLSSTLGGTSFAPIEGAERTSALLLTNHNIRPEATVKALVELGPKALPLLLQSLDDSTPTKLVIDHDTSFGIMWFDCEMGLNPAIPREWDAVAALPRHRFGEEKPAAHYTVKVGDVCMVIVGQITGRGYQAVRYQPTACVVLNSPTAEPQLAAAIRTIWAQRDDEPDILAKSLLTDLRTEGVFNGQSLDGWYTGNGLRIEAARRLMYYYPNLTGRLVASMIDRLDLSKFPEDEWIAKTVANKVRADEFLAAVNWSTHAEVVAALGRALERSTDPAFALAAISPRANKDDPAVAGKLMKLLEAAPNRNWDAGPFADEYQLLLALGACDSPQVRPVFDDWAKTEVVGKRRAMCAVLSRVRGEWAAELLAQYLDDKTTFGWTYAIKPGRNAPRREIRVCDEAAEAIARARKDLEFSMSGDHENLDRQIAAIKAQLGSR